MIKFLTWLFWNLYYLPQPRPRNLTKYIIWGMRTRWPWWKFKPFVMRNDDGNMWEVYLKDDCDFVRSATIRVDAHISRDTGEIVGIKLFDEQLASQA